MASCVARGFDQNDYSKLHPAGEIGRRLTRVEEIMRIGSYHCIVSEDLTVKQVIRQYIETKGGPGAASVVNKQGKLVGIFTDGDLRRLLGEGEQFLDASIGSVIGREPKVISPLASAREALDLISQLRVDQLVVTNDECEPVGMLDIQDLAEVTRSGLRNNCVDDE
jgi:arabinose-5-phosphate isomerase